MKKLLLTALFVMLVIGLLMSSISLTPEGCTKRNTQSCAPSVTKTSGVYYQYTPVPTWGTVYTPSR